MNLERLKSIFISNGCDKVYTKILAPNDNSKNQVYLGNDQAFNIFPLSDIEAIPAGDWERERFIATANFAWVSEEGNLYKAPEVKFILYPKYPEVRFSGFLKRCEKAPSDLMTSRLPGRVLFLSVSDQGQILGYVAAPDSTLSEEFLSISNEMESEGLFKTFSLKAEDGKSVLLAELTRIHQLSWIDSKRLDRDGNILPCNAANCGGYTLEAELGITPNGYSEPDYLGWEVKQYSVTNLLKPGNATITLMTPEPTEGLYVTEGVDYFIRSYGYADLKGRPDRLNFGGVHLAGVAHARTKLTLELIGYDAEENKIKSAAGRIALVDKEGYEAAAWSFASMLKHWNRKHNQACYVPSVSTDSSGRKYRYGGLITLGVETDFQLFLKQMHSGNIFYDPGIKLENASTVPKIKRRSQFRIKSSNLSTLYKKHEIVNLMNKS